MQHDVRLRAAARAIFDACYPSDEWVKMRFDEAERLGASPYRHAVAAAIQARSLLSSVASVQLELI